MEKCRLDFNKYRDILTRVFSTYTEKELEDFFIYQVKYLEILVECVEGIYNQI
jgi:hypothetical protein